MLRLRRFGFLLPAAVTGSLWLKGLHPGLPGWSCPLRALSGIPCPTCFLSRATSAALIGDLPLSLHLHAFGPAVAAGLLLWSAVAIRQRRLLPRSTAGPLPLARLGGMGAVLLLSYWALRLGPLGFPQPPPG
ncbi:DUF2752 domain-containing protein [Cyanobium sp. FGCU-6]|nr:DUF2752 domain-containing protein [Cyanobium sp. FGCU6]